MTVGQEDEYSLDQLSLEVAREVCWTEQYKGDSINGNAQSLVWGMNLGLEKFLEWQTMMASGRSSKDGGSRYWGLTIALGSYCASVKHYGETASCHSPTRHLFD